ncbi:MAG: 5-oxoprolinase subunit PxpB [Flavobacteriaceae bacterium]|nr:5-oxoprolinase subunit PxpB [Flavobacteriaceae bacterium]
MGRFELSFERYGRQAILINWPQIIDDDVLFDMLDFKKSIIDHYIELKVEINSAYNSIIVSYITTIRNIYDEILTLKSIYSKQNNTRIMQFQRIHIPVCYDEKFGIDISRISDETKLSKNDVIRLHQDVDYRVFFIGFLPGFLYLGGMDDRLICPRLSTPRKEVAMGSVAIGGHQTGIYPISSPGGWNIIGRSPINFFDPSQENPCIAQAGDKVRFESINFSEYEKIKEAVKRGNYKLKIENIHD